MKFALSWLLQLVAAFILGQTLFFKFSGAPEPIHIFTTLGAEPYGRLGTAVLELVAVALLLIPRKAALGGLLGAGLMVGAIGAHLTQLGIEIRLPGADEGDGGLLFTLACVAFAASLGVAWLRRADLPLVGARLAARGA